MAAVKSRRWSCCKMAWSPGSLGEHRSLLKMSFRVIIALMPLFCPRFNVASDTPPGTASAGGSSAARRVPNRAVAMLGLATAVFLLAMTPGSAHAHGGVVEEDDVCVLRIDYLKAHFKAYQPRTSGHSEFCEDLPDAAETVFILEYLHDDLARLPIEFRIIRNTTGKGRFARWDDIQALEDLDGVTVFHMEPVVEPDVFSVVHEFDSDGEYIGIVTIATESNARLRIAVFPFEVGFTGMGWWPYIAGLLVLIQLQYLWMSGRLARCFAARKKR